MVKKSNMERLVVYNKKSIASYISKRKGETKYGEEVHFLENKEEIETSLLNATAEFVLLGVPEDIGVRANHGRPGATGAWEVALKALLNTQDNKFNKAEKLLILGHLDFSKEIEEMDAVDFSEKEHFERANELVSFIDEEVTKTVKAIADAGKTPIVIGGGHNNAYGCIKGTALAFGRAVNSINFDAHTDFRSLEGRHSGNGFSYAFEEGFLNTYFMFGIHENYTSASMLKTFKKNKKKLKYVTFESIEVERDNFFDEQLRRATIFIEKKPFGIEIDLDAIQSFPSSAMSPSGFSVNKARRFVSYLGLQSNASYLHICEGAPALGEKGQEMQVGKLISFLVTDFIKSKSYS